MSGQERAADWTTDERLSELLDADQRCLAAAETFLDSLNDHPSPVGYRRLLDALGAARETAERHEPDGRLARLLIRHLSASWDVLETVARYRYTWPRVAVAEVIEALAGPGAVARLEARVAGNDPEQTWAYIEFRHAYQAGRVAADRPGVRSSVEETTARMAREFRDWIEAGGQNLPGLDAEVVLGPDQASHSWYQPARHRIVLGGAEFMVFESGAEIRVNAVIALHSLAHELAGHAVQDALSRELPPPLRPDDRSRLRFATLPISEGYAAHASALALDFARERGEAVGLERADVDFLRQMNEMSVVHQAIPAMVSVLAARARQEPGFDAVAYMAEQCGQPGFGEMLAAAQDEPAYRLIYDNACFFGAEEVRRIAGGLAAHGVDGVTARRALGSGAWALSCYGDAVQAMVEAAAAAREP